MQLSNRDLTLLLDVAIEAAKKAGAIIASYSSKSVAVQHKHTGENLASQVLTEVDLRSEAEIISVLQDSCDQYDIALLSEESQDDQSRLHKDCFWCVDPMDGTLSFIESTPGYAVSVALVSRAGIPLIGVVYDPTTRNLYSAVTGQGAMLNGEIWTLSKPVTASEHALTLVCDRGFTHKSYYENFYQALLSLAIKQGYSGLKVRQKNGAVMNACWVLENPPACYVKCPKPEQGGGCLWDFAATAALYNELACVATDFFGGPLDLNRADSSFMNHKGVIYSTEPALAQAIGGLLELCHL